jgi:hypothetical protein
MELAPHLSSIAKVGRSAAATTAGPWNHGRPTESHVGLQSILLQEADYEVSEAIRYYAAEKSRVTIPVSEVLRDEALATLKAAKDCAVGSRPLPLVNDSRCPRCSLQPIAVTAFNRGELKEGHLARTTAGCISLTPAARRFSPFTAAAWPKK